MIARNLVALAGAALMVAGTFALARADAVRPIDPSKSTASFCISHVFVGQVCGTVPIVGGSVTMMDGTTVPTAISAELDPARMDTGDPDRDASLEGPNYFDVKQFPSWSFTSTRIVGENAGFRVDGLLTMHGVTQPVHLDATVTGDASHVEYRATCFVDRRVWGMRGTPLDPAIGDVADVTLDVVPHEQGAEVRADLRSARAVRVHLSSASPTRR
jgi:polyisoprenoid-binding protein YceI